MTRPRVLSLRTRVFLGAAALVACVAVCAAYLYVRYLDVTRYRAVQGRVTV